METLEYTESSPKCGYGEIHDCKRSLHVTKSLFYMVNHSKRHRLPLESSSYERNDLEKYYCKECNFETYLVVILKQHRREYHRNNADCVEDQPKNDAIVKSYICQKCSFETYSVLLWIKHLESSCFNREEECENVRTVSCSDEEWYRCECCSFENKRGKSFEKTPKRKSPISPEGKISLFPLQLQRKNKKSFKGTRKLQTVYKRMWDRRALWNLNLPTPLNSSTTNRQIVKYIHKLSTRKST
jgi:hypothetical protein